MIDRLVRATVCAALLALAQSPAFSASQDRLIELEGGRNFRDLGGYQTPEGKSVKWGMIYRSGVMVNLTDADYATLEERNISTVVDFRSNEERMREPTVWRAGPVRTLTFSYDMGSEDTMRRLFGDQPTGESAEAAMTALYPELLHQQRAHYVAMFDELTGGGEPLVFHCSAGKDRTGVAAALILIALGVDRETAIQDYTLSEQYLDWRELLTPKTDRQLSPEERARMAALANVPPEALAAVAGTRAPYIEAALSEMERVSGSVMAYITEELEVDDAQLAALRSLYLE